MDFGRACVGAIAKAEVCSLVVRRDIAAGTQNVLTHADAVGCEEDFSTNGVARAAFPADEAKFDPVVVVGVHVAQKDGDPIEYSNLWLKGDSFRLSAIVKRDKTITVPQSSLHLINT